MALVDVLEIIPESHSGYQSLLTILQTLAPKTPAADPTTGVWWLVMSQSERAENYFESSGSAMFVYGFLKGLRKGYLNDPSGSLLAGSRKAYKYIIDHWVIQKNETDTMDWTNTGGKANYGYYVAQNQTLNDLKGLSAFVLASLEYESL